MKTVAISTMGMLLLSACVAGCGESVDAKVVSVREKLVLSSKPTASTSIKKIRAALQEDDADKEQDVTILARITAGDLPPWETGKAAFIVTDASGHEGEQDHDPHTCPFCSRKINDYLGKLQFHNNDGDVIAIDSRELFDVKEKQLVIIKGRASIDDEDILDVAADGIYIVR